MILFEGNHLHDPWTGGTQRGRRIIAACRRHRLVFCQVPIRTGYDPTREPRPCGCGGCGHHVRPKDQFVRDRSGCRSTARTLSTPARSRRHIQCRYSAVL